MANYARLEACAPLAKGGYRSARGTWRASAKWHARPCLAERDQRYHPYLDPYRDGYYCPREATARAMAKRGEAGFAARCCAMDSSCVGRLRAGAVRRDG